MHKATLLGALALAALCGATVTWLWPFAANGPEAPMVRDDAGLMTDEQRAAVTGYHQHLLNAFDIDYRVVTVRHLGDINQAAVEMFRASGAASRSRAGRALLLLIDAGSDQVRLEVGYPLEGAFPDAFVDYVERHQMVRFFELGRVADGIVATTELIVTRAQRSAEGLGTAAEAWTASSGGAGAVTEARLSAGPRRASASPVDVRPGATPEETLLAYFQAMAAHNADPQLAIYTRETRQMLAGHLMTPAQMDNLVATYRRCPPPATLVSSERSRAVIRYPASARVCAPFFLQRPDDRWLVDLTMMQRAIRFDTANRWRFDPAVSHPYGFAFEDWRLDARGYPHPHEPVAHDE